MVNTLQDALSEGQITSILPCEESEEVLDLFKQHFPRHVVSTWIDLSVTMVVSPPLTEQEQRQWRNTLTVHYTQRPPD